LEPDRKVRKKSVAAQSLAVNHRLILISVHASRTIPGTALPCTLQAQRPILSIFLYAGV
jgi:hypothetical protein